MFVWMCFYITHFFCLRHRFDLQVDTNIQEHRQKDTTGFTELESISFSLHWEHPDSAGNWRKTCLDWDLYPEGLLCELLSQFNNEQLTVLHPSTKKSRVHWVAFRLHTTLSSLIVVLRGTPWIYSRLTTVDNSLSFSQHKPFPWPLPSERCIISYTLFYTCNMHI